MDGSINRLGGFAFLLTAGGAAIYVAASREEPFYWAFPIVLATSGLTILARDFYPDIFPDWLPERTDLADEDSPSRRAAEDRNLWN